MSARARTLAAALLLASACATTSARRQQLESDYRACAQGSAEGRPDERLQATTDAELAALLEACRRAAVQERAEHQRLATEKDSARKDARARGGVPAKAEEPAREDRSPKAEAAPGPDDGARLAAISRDFCLPTALATGATCDRALAELSPRFPFSPGVCERSAGLARSACLNHSWDRVIGERDAAARAALRADYAARAVLGGCLLAHGATAELEPTAEETRARCQALAGAVRNALVGRARPPP
ncbi:MAG TPA: hypothetical protein VML50_03785 [Anaeromyxobacter sp.]|nr:hypothetical protein [Anaeromyxobacter sp.]